MPRRTITIATGLDNGVRSYQATLIRQLNKDVTYTEALNIVLVMGFFRPGTTTMDAFWKDAGGEATQEDREALLEGFLDREKLRLEGIIDML